MKTKHQRRYKCNCSKIKSIKEKRLKLLQRHLAVLKTSIIYFPPKTPQKTRRHHLPHNSTLSATNRPPTSKQVDHSSRHNLSCPKQLKKIFHKAQAISQWRRKWSTDSIFLLHTQHLSITMTCYFLRLSIVKIFPRTADQAKKAPS